MRGGGSSGQPVLALVRAQPRRAAAFALIAAGGLAVTAGSISVTGASTPQEQLSYLISASLGGLVLLVGGVATLLEAGLRDDERLLRELTAAVRTGGRPESSENGFGSGLRVALLTLGLGAVLVTVGWNQAALADDERGAVPGLLTGIAGVLVVAAVAAVRLRRMRASTVTARNSVTAPLTERYGPDEVTVDLATAAPVGSASSDAVLVGPGLTRFHRAGCPTLSDVEATSVRRADIDSGLRPCQLCEAAGR